MAKFCGKDLLIQRVYTPDGAWVALTAYVIGDIVTNSGNVYRATASGTSAASGGPSTTGSAIVDGSVTWEYISAASGGFGFLTIAGMRSTSLSINNEQVDVTDKDDGQWRQLLQCGIRSMELSAAGMFTDAAIMRDIMADVVAGAINAFRIVSGAGDEFQGNYLVASCERSGEYNQAEQYTLSLASAGAITYTAI